MTYLKPGVFFVAFAIGMAGCYLSAPRPTVVVKFPTPYNAGKITYRREDDPDACFKYRAEKVPCTGDALPQPV
jgi:hypothetical protein